MVSSWLDHRNSIYMGLTFKTVQKLFPNASAWAVMSVSWYSHISPLLWKLHWLSVDFLCNSKLFGFLRGCLCPYVSAYLVRWVGVGTYKPYQLSRVILWDLGINPCLWWLLFCEITLIPSCWLSANLDILLGLGLGSRLSPFCLLCFVFCICSLVVWLLVSCFLNVFFYFFIGQILVYLCGFKINIINKINKLKPSWAHFWARNLYDLGRTFAMFCFHCVKKEG